MSAARRVGVAPRTLGIAALLGLTLAGAGLADAALAARAGEAEPAARAGEAGPAAGAGGTGPAAGAGRVTALAEVVPGLVGRREITLSDGSVPVALAPDGARLAAVGPAVDSLRGEICVLDVATLAVIACSDGAALDTGVDPASIRWSPDGARLAFTEDRQLTGLDGDLWVMDAATGALVNVDDDGFSGVADHVLGLPHGTVTLPMAPAFTPDGNALTYGRLVASGGTLQREEIVTVPVTGGAAEVLLALPGPPFARGATAFGGAWAPDGSRFYTSIQTDALAAGEGIVALDADGTAASTLAGVADVNAGAPAVAAVSPDGRAILGFLHRLGATYGGAANAWLLLDPATARVTPVQPQDAMLALYTYIGQAGFSPDGRWLLTVTRGTDPDGQVAVRPVDGGAETVLIAEGVGASASIEGGMPLNWAADGTVLIPGDPSAGTATLLTLDGGGVPG